MRDVQYSYGAIKRRVSLKIGAVLVLMPQAAAQAPGKQGDLVAGTAHQPQIIAFLLVRQRPKIMKEWCDPPARTRVYFSRGTATFLLNYQNVKHW